MDASRLNEEIAILRGWRQLSVGYDKTSIMVNASYARTQDIRQTMRKTRLSFDVVWEMVGFKDQMDFIG